MRWPVTVKAQSSGTLVDGDATASSATLVDGDATVSSACRLVGRLPAAVIARFTCESVMVDHYPVSFYFASTCACDIRLPVALTCVTAAMRASLIDFGGLCATETARAPVRAAE